MLRELSLCEPAHGLVVENLERLSDLSLVGHFRKSSPMRENIFWTLGTFIQPESLGKKKFRPWITFFLDAAFRYARDVNQNVHVKAQEFLIACALVYG